MSLKIKHSGKKMGIDNLFYVWIPILFVIPYFSNDSANYAGMASEVSTYSSLIPILFDDFVHSGGHASSSQL